MRLLIAFKNWVFLKKPIIFLPKSPRKFWKSLNLVTVFYHNGSQSVRLLRSSQSGQCFVFFLEKQMGFNEEVTETSQNHWTKLISVRKSLKNYYCSRNVKTWKLGISVKMMFFLRKLLESFQEHWTCQTFSRLRLRVSYCLRIIEMFKKWFFGKIAGIVFWKKFQQVSRNVFYWQKFYRMCLKWYYCLRVLENFELWGLL